MNRAYTFRRPEFPLVPPSGRPRRRRRLPPRLWLLTIAAAALMIPRVATQGGDLSRAIDVVDGHEVVAGEALVRFHDPGRRNRRLELAEVQSDRPVGRGLRRVRVRGARSRDLIASLRRRADVASVEPNYIVRPTSRVPNDPFFYTMWALLNRMRPGADIGAAAAWDSTTGSRSKVVALIDTGVDYRHPDLAANIWSAPAPFTVTVGGVSITCPAGSHGFDAIGMTCNPHDDFGHGTAMAGLIGAVGNNGIGIAGVNWNSTILPVKFMKRDDRGEATGTYADALDAIEFVIQAKAIFANSGSLDVRVMSNSWAGTAYSEALSDQIVRAGAAGLLFVASAGNADAAHFGLPSDNDTTPFYPASFAAANILSVAATTQNDTLDPISNYGRSTIDLAAPAMDYSTSPGGSYAATGGTSAAAAVASGAAALVLSQCNLSIAELKKNLMAGTDPLGSLQGMTASGGRINVDRSIDLCRGGNSAPFVTLLSPAHQDRFDAPADVTITADAQDADGSIARVEFYANTSLIGTDTTAPYSTTWRGVEAGVYSLAGSCDR